MYDPALGRFHTLDPLGELTYSWTPYRYGFNNPLRFIDPNGMSETDIYGRNRYDENGMYIPPQDRKDPDPSGGNMPSFSGNFLEDLGKLIGDAFADLFLDKEEIAEGKEVIKVKEEVAAVQGGPVAIIISGNGSGSFMIGGIDAEQGVVIVLQGEDKGVYALTDLGGVVGSTQLAGASATGKVTAVFYTGDSKDFKVDKHLGGTRTEANVGIGAPLPVTATVNFGGFVGSKDKSDGTRAMGLYIGAGGTASIQSLGAVSLQVNIGGTDVY